MQTGLLQEAKNQNKLTSVQQQLSYSRLLEVAQLALEELKDFGNTFHKEHVLN